MKDRMPYKPGTQKSFYTVNRKQGIMTIPFPDMYIKHKEYPRLVGYSKNLMKSSGFRDINEFSQMPSCSTLVSTDKNYKKALIRILDELLKPFGLKFYEWDLSACHTKILVSLFPDETPLIRKVF